VDQAIDSFVCSFEVCISSLQVGECMNRVSNFKFLMDLILDPLSSLSEINQI
jgi:hypothetical protein